MSTIFCEKCLINLSRFLRSNKIKGSAEKYFQRNPFIKGVFLFSLMKFLVLSKSNRESVVTL